MERSVMFVEEISCTKWSKRREAIEFSVLYFHNISFDCRSHPVVTSPLLVCIESFFMLPILSAFLMLKRDGKWQLPVIYNSSVSSTRRHGAAQSNIWIDANTHPGNFYSRFSLHTLCSVTSFILSFSPCPFHFLRTNNKISNQNVFTGKKL